MVDLAQLAAAVEAALYRRGAKLEAGQLRIDCPSPGHQGNPAKDARYSPEKQAWTCFVCGASGGLLVGDVPLARALGIEAAGEWTEAQREQWRRDAAEAHRQAEAARAEAAVRLAAYWEAHREWRTAEARARVLDYLAAGGIDEWTADHFGLTGGTWKGRPALVIPWTFQGKLLGVQYRWLSGSGRYETHPGSTLRVFNCDAVAEPVDTTIVVVEGAKKCAAVWSAGWNSVCAVRNKGGWAAKWGSRFDAFDRVVFALDPDAGAEARDAARTVRRGYVATLPMKPDDMLTATRGDTALLLRYIEHAERVMP